MRRLDLSVALWVAGILALSSCDKGIAETVAGAWTPPGANDVIVFTAEFRPELYRIEGDQTRPWSEAKFYSPKALVASHKEACFYVLDEPRLNTDAVKLWRIGADGAARVVYEAPFTTNGGPFGDPVSLGLDADGRLLVADSVTGLWRLGVNGSLQQLTNNVKPLYRITAVADTPDGLLLGSSYQYEITGGGIPELPGERVGTWSTMHPQSQGGAGDRPPEIVSWVGDSTGRQVPIRIWHNQGGLFRTRLEDPNAALVGMLVNREPGGQEFDTLWRTVTQLLVDSGGRIVLVDNGSKRRISGRDSVINGGIHLVHPDGTYENLMYKTPTQTSTPLRRPRGAAQWDEQTYLVADPEMYVEQQMEGPGGLCLLRLDGSRDPRWKTGWQIKPNAVAILRQ